MNGQCGARRTKTKKSKKGVKRRRTQKGGMGYGFGGAMGTNGPVWDASWGGEVTKAGAPVYDTADPQRGSSRRRKNKKTGKRRKSMKGGAPWTSVAPVGHGFVGTGSRGIADAVGYASKVPVAGGPTQNPDGAYRP